MSDTDFPDEFNDPLFVTLGPDPIPVSGTFTLSPATFDRILNGNLLDTEEARKDSPSSFISGFEYIGVAPSGSLTSSSVWNIVRISYDVRGRQERFQFQPNIVWEPRQCSFAESN